MADENLALQVFQTMVGVVGICGNGLVCAVIGKIRVMHTLTNAFIFNQALIDLLGSMMILLYSVVPIPAPLPPGTAGDLFCKFWVSGYFRWALFVSSTLNLEALTLERYLAIVFPFRYQVLATRKNTIIGIIAAWVIGFAFTTYNIHMNHEAAGQCATEAVAHGQLFGVVVFFMAWLIPVTIMLVVYVHIAMVLKKGVSRIQPGPATADPSTTQAPETQGESLMRARRNTFKTLLIVSAAFIICWSPNAIIFLLFNFNVPIDFTSSVYYVSVALVATNSCVNPFIYAIKYRQFQNALKTLIGRKGTTDDGSSVATQTVRPE